MSRWKRALGARCDPSLGQRTLHSDSPCPCDGPGQRATKSVFTRTARHGSCIPNGVWGRCSQVTSPRLEPCTSTGFPDQFRRDQWLCFELQPPNHPTCPLRTIQHKTTPLTPLQPRNTASCPLSRSSTLPPPHSPRGSGSGAPSPHHRTLSHTMNLASLQYIRKKPSTCVL
ncbi:hypothetical protein IQ07DRAFT_588800 [Pyrenochaeta sp. DS3sAY3a]|nr:hypothetical protein IQ07DRAFT_588800 [Pyrenochaeta sp. DS3sAY3a]